MSLDLFICVLFASSLRSPSVFCFFFFNDTATTEIYTLSYTTLFRSGHWRCIDSRPDRKNVTRTRRRYIGPEDQPFPIGRPARIVQVPLLMKLHHCRCAAIGPLGPQISCACRGGRRERHGSAVWCPRGAKIVVSLERQLDARPSVQPLDPDIKGLSISDPRYGEPLPLR